MLSYLLSLSVILSVVIFFATGSAFAMESKDLEVFGYARAGVGTSTLGGDQECFYNQGAGGWGGIGRNEFRLGNECSNYMELGFKFNHLKGESNWAYSQIRLSNSHNGSDSTESSSQSTQIVELFTEAYGLDQIPASFWIGKRFYRDQDVHIDDYFYFGAMNGNGAGLSNLRIFGGDFSIAYLKKVDDSKSFNTSTLIASEDPKTEKGKTGINVLDLRLKNVTLTEKIKQNFWIAVGQSPGGTDTVSLKKYGATTGYLLGTLLDLNLNNDGFNHFAILYGQGLMNSFNMYGDSTVEQGTEQDTQDDKHRLRVINHTTYKLNSKWQGHLSLSHEQVYNTATAAENWNSIALRPIYVVTDHFQLVTEAGYSVVSDGIKRSLYRLTLAPQLSLNSNIWGRPVLRAYYTHSFWNEENKPFIAQNAPSYIDKDSGGAYGFQMETNF
jgi:maltoporin